MTLNYDTLTALVNVKYMPTMINLVFRKHYLALMLKNKAKEFSGRKIHIPLEYADSTENVQFTSAYETLNLSPVDIATGADEVPKMLTGHLTISKEEELVMNSDEAVINILNAKMNNLTMSIDKVMAQKLWVRSQGTKDWNSLYTIVGESALHGIPATGDVPDWWKSRIIDASDGTRTGDPTLEADLMDPTKGVYIKKLLRQLIAKIKWLNGEKPDVIVLGQYLWDLLESVEEEKKRYTVGAATQAVAKLGFDAIDFRGIPVIADDDMVDAQTGDDDGYIYGLTLKYLYFFFNKNAKFVTGKFIEPTNQNSRTAKVHAYGNLLTSNRFVQGLIKNVKSVKAYSA